jgi:hypothetical protein
LDRGQRDLAAAADRTERGGAPDPKGGKARERNREDEAQATNRAELARQLKIAKRLPKLGDELQQAFAVVARGRWGLSRFCSLGGDCHACEYGINSDT